MIKPTDGMVITEDTLLEPGVYFVPNGIRIIEDGITLDGNGATIIGRARDGRGIQVKDQQGVTIRNLKLRDFYHGIYARRCNDLTITDCQITSTAEVAANTVFLDIWLDAERAYGGGILLQEVEDSAVSRNDLQHQMNGLLTYDCKRLTVRENNASYCSAFGIHLYGTSDSLFEENFADYCTRWQPRGGRGGHMGADAAGFLVVAGASRNIFRRNYARMGGDGFFVAGLNPRFEFRPCNNNLFEENDVSYSPNIGFEATFCASNIFRSNTVHACNYGFWLGFSATNVLQNNTINHCIQAGIAVENGYGFVVQENRLFGNTHGILLWSKHIPQFDTIVPKNTTSYNWRIERNTFQRHDKAIRIAANQDHGVRGYPAGGQRPYNHLIEANTITDNRIGIELVGVERTVMQHNSLSQNVEADVRE